MASLASHFYESSTKLTCWYWPTHSANRQQETRFIDQLYLCNSIWVHIRVHNIWWGYDKSWMICTTNLRMKFPHIISLRLANKKITHLISIYKCSKIFKRTATSRMFLLKNTGMSTLVMHSSQDSLTKECAKNFSKNKSLIFSKHMTLLDR